MVMAVYGNFIGGYLYVLRMFRDSNCVRMIVNDLFGETALSKEASGVLFYLPGSAESALSC